MMTHASSGRSGAPHDRRPHLLYVAWGFPPCRGGGVYRGLATANRFARLGWRVTVLTVERDTFVRFTGTDPTLEARIDPAVEVVRVPFAWPVHEPDLRRWSRFRARFPRAWAKWRARRDTVAFPEVGYGPWRRVIEAAAERIHAGDPVDLVLATANPHVAFTAAWRLHRRHGVPYVMDYRDAWLLDVFSGERLHSPRSRAARWERRLVAGAREVWFVNDPIRDWHRRLYPAHADRMRTVANGFDAELAPAPTGERPPVGDRPVVFGYVGTVTPKVPLAEFVRGWQHGRATSPSLAGAEARIHGYLGFYGQPRPDLLAVIDSASADGVSYRGPVGKADIAATYAGFDVLLLILGAGRYVTSGKVFEYLATGLPVVSVHEPGNAATDVLRGHPLWFPVADLRPETVAAALAAAAEAARSATQEQRAQARAFGAGYRRDLQLDPRIEALRGAPVAVEAAS
ncbi:glycosyltransferase [Jiangella sp. DSM 45060]|uniref:glycosyltransferase n=1 Tax=Jiangella sp. DSM 45060 TaxID=1798224 RepID=UPI00087DB647|nr:glycosyltransferase [Jiangella sp. DSM 45060]SDS13373.1 Glycosyltransferase involved in cell wall bisynthesis [Jiangella sp. DSM 45060]